MPLSGGSKKRHLAGDVEIEPTKKRQRSEQNLPNDVIIEILRKLPAKSLCKFRCVCKAWRALICPHFVRAAGAINKLFYMTYEYYSLTDCNEAAAAASVSDANLTTAKFEFSFKKPPSEFDIQLYWIITSCDGWMLLNFILGTVDYRLWLFHPLTTEYREFPCHPNLSPRPRSSYYGIYHDHSANDLTVVNVGKVHREHERIIFTVFSFKTNSWTEPKFLPNWIASVATDAVSVNGIPHWSCKCTDATYSIVRFDPKDEFKCVPKPPHRSRCFDYGFSLAAMTGNLCAYRNDHSHHTLETVVWEMKQYGVKESWTQVCRINIADTDLRWVKPVAFIKKGKLILLTTWECDLFTYNLEDSSIKTFGTFGRAMCKIEACAGNSITSNCDCWRTTSSIIEDA